MEVFRYFLSASIFVGILKDDNCIPYIKTHLIYFFEVHFFVLTFPIIIWYNHKFYVIKHRNMEKIVKS